MRDHFLDARKMILGSWALGAGAMIWVAMDAGKRLGKATGASCARRTKEGKAMSINTVFLIGRLTRDPESKYTSSGIQVTSFSLAVDRAYRNAQGEVDTDFLSCVAWRKLAQLVLDFCVKGKQVAVVGHLEQQRWLNQAGENRSQVVVVCDKVEFLANPRACDGGGVGAVHDGHDRAAHADAGAGGQEQNIDGQDSHFDDDLPF